MISSSAGGGVKIKRQDFLGNMGYRLHFCKMPLASRGYHPQTPNIYMCYIYGCRFIFFFILFVVISHPQHLVFN